MSCGYDYVDMEYVYMCVECNNKCDYWTSCVNSDKEVIDIKHTHRQLTYFLQQLSVNPKVTDLSEKPESCYSFGLTLQCHSRNITEYFCP